MTLSRSTPLRPNREHDFEGQDASDWRQCDRCGYWLAPGKKPQPYCPGMKQQRLQRRQWGLDRRSPLNSVSPDRDAKRKKRGIRGALCDFVRGRQCLVPGCEAPSDPAHVKNVGAGHADWFRGAGEPYPKVVWWGNVCRLCRRHHREFDGDIGGGSGHLFAARYDISPRAEARKLGAAFADEHDIDLTADRHPYEQMEAGSGA